MNKYINDLSVFKKNVGINDENREIVLRLSEIGILEKVVDQQSSHMQTRINNQYAWLLKTEKENKRGSLAKLIDIIGERIIG